MRTTSSSLILASVLLLTAAACANDSTTVQINAGVSMTMILIPAGSFTMGSPPTEVGRQPAGALWPSADHTDETQHMVNITRPFYIGKYHVTQAQWQAVKGNSSYNSYGQLIGGSEGPNYPAHTMAWGDAQDFCVRLSASTGRVIRLPTESEWEYACRAGATTEYFWGDDGGQMDTYVISHSNTLMSTYHYGKGYTGGPPPVGLLQPNPWGLYDALGLISVWTGDWYAYYPAGPIDNPTGPATGSYKVARGGNYDCGPAGLRPALRDPELLNLDVSLRWFYGLRVVMEADVSTGASGRHGSRTNPAGLQMTSPRNGAVTGIYSPSGRLIPHAADRSGLQPGTYIVREQSADRTPQSRLLQVP